MGRRKGRRCEPGTCSSLTFPPAQAPVSMYSVEITSGWKALRKQVFRKKNVEWQWCREINVTVYDSVPVEHGQCAAPCVGTAWKQIPVSHHCWGLHLTHHPQASSKFRVFMMGSGTMWKIPQGLGVCQVCSAMLRSSVWANPAASAGAPPLHGCPVRVLNILPGKSSPTSSSGITASNEAKQLQNIHLICGANLFPLVIIDVTKFVWLLSLVFPIGSIYNLFHAVKTLQIFYWLTAAVGRVLGLISVGIWGRAQNPLSLN